MSKAIDWIVCCVIYVGKTNCITMNSLFPPSKKVRKIRYDNKKLISLLTKEVTFSDFFFLEGHEHNLRSKEDFILFLPKLSEQECDTKLIF